MTSSPLRTLFFWVYLGVCVVVWGVALPFLALLSIKRKYRNSLPARFFFIGNKRLPQGSIWFHACSLGEVISLSPLLKEDTKTPIVVSATTHTGYEQIQKEYQGVHARYLPFEPLLLWWMNRPKVIVVTEAELWPMIFLGGKIFGAKILYINARISQRSFQRARRVKFLYRVIMNNIDHIYAQSEEDKKRFEHLGGEKITVFGNIKRFRPIVPAHTFSRPQGVVVVAASTHEGEEELIVNAYATVRKETTMKLIVVPRHPERFDKVASKIEVWSQGNNVAYHRFSRDGWEGEWEIMVIDCIGELLSMYAIADIVVLGGSFVPVGGHNPLEPATFHVRLISGPSVFNQTELFSHVSNAHIVTKEMLKEYLSINTHLPTASVIRKGEIDQLVAEIYG